MRRLQRNCIEAIQEKIPGLKKSQAKQLMAGFFGYKLPDQFYAEEKYRLELLSEAEILLPARALVQRILNTMDLRNTDNAEIVCNSVSSVIAAENLFPGEFWNTSSLRTYLMEQFLPDNFCEFEELLAEEIASTNAYFDRLLLRHGCARMHKSEITVEVEGALLGETHYDKTFSGDEIDFRLDLRLQLISCRIGYLRPTWNIAGSVKSWAEFEYS